MPLRHGAGHAHVDHGWNRAGGAIGCAFHKGGALQRLQDVQVIAFDKTGTLTEGKSTLTDVACDTDHAQLLHFVAGVESRSEHPIARAIVAATETVAQDVTGFSAILGKGASATVDGHLVHVGNIELLQGAGHTNIRQVA